MGSRSPFAALLCPLKPLLPRSPASPFRFPHLVAPRPAWSPSPTVRSAPTYLHRRCPPASTPFPGRLHPLRPLPLSVAAKEDPATTPESSVAAEEEKRHQRSAERRAPCCRPRGLPELSAQPKSGRCSSRHASSRHSDLIAEKKWAPTLAPSPARSMFCLSLIEHDLRLPPHLLSLPLLKGVRGELERLFLDKVISNLGLCVSVYDIQSIEGGFILPGDGASTYKVAFRLVMFRPFIGEILTGKIESSNESGLKISLGFFNDIHIPAHLLQQPSSLGEDGIWNWKVSGELLPLDLDEEIRFRVSNVKYPPVPVKQEENAKPFAPMEITGDIYGDGLGLLSWWEEE